MAKKAKKKVAKRSKTKKKATKARSLKTRRLKAGQATAVKGGATAPLPGGSRDPVGIKVASPGIVSPTSPIVGIK